MKKLTIITMLCCFNIAMSMDSNKQDADKQGIIEKLSSQKAPNSFSMGHSVTPANNAQPRFELAPRQGSNLMVVASKVLSGQLQSPQPNGMNAINNDDDNIIIGLANNNNNDDDDDMMFDVANDNDNDDDDNDDDDDDNMMFDVANDNDNDDNDDDNDNDDDSPANLIKRKHFCSHQGCKKSYAFPYDLSRHIKAVHTSRQSATCRYCNRLLARSYNCKLHEPTCKRNPEVMAKSASFNASSHNNNNNNNHITDGKHRCGIDGCTKEYATKGSRQQHIRTRHTNERHRCGIDGCTKEYVTKNNLEQHIIAIHTDPESATCKECSIHFSTVVDFKKHMNAKHDDQESAKCKYCNIYFSRKDYRKSHEAICRSNPAYVASLASCLVPPQPPANNNNNNNNNT